jgi:multiple sugar transport system ATP-binding protein
MNVFDVTALPPGRVRWSDYTVGVPSRLHAAVACGGRELLLGVRPEHVYVQGSRWARANQAGPPIPATVDTVELAGDQIFLELRIAETLLVARAEPDLRIQGGDRLDVWFDTDALHLFDPISEAALGGEAVA